MGRDQDQFVLSANGYTQQQDRQPQHKLAHRQCHLPNFVVIIIVALN